MGQSNYATEILKNTKTTVSAMKLEAKEIKQEEDSQIWSYWEVKAFVT